MLKFLAKLFGNKQDKDVQQLRPIVSRINEHFAKLSNLSDDELRGRSDDFRARIAEHLSKIREKMLSVAREAEGTADVGHKEKLYADLETLKKERNKQVEEILEKILPEAFAVVKETARRLTQNKELRVKATDWDRNLSNIRPNIVIEGDTAIWKNTWMAAGGEIVWNMVHYDVQLMGGIVLHQGKIAEMATGEGKTLVSTLPTYLNALSGMGVHVVTVNDYLARRDSEWNGPLFEFHKISVDCIDRHEPNSPARRNAYRADITYGTNNEFGFDYLRDNMASHPESLVQREHHYAVVDEIDSVLIDEARTPLIIAGPVPNSDRHEYNVLKPRIERLVNAQRRVINECLNDAKRNLGSDDKEKAKKAGENLFRAHRGLPKYGPLIKYLSESGIKTELLKVEGYFMQDKGKNMHLIDEELYFTIDEKNNTIELTEIGRELITAEGEDPNLFVLPDVASALSEITADNGLSEEEKIARKDVLARDFADKSERLHSINQLLKAYTLFEKDVEYIVQEGKVVIVDEQTGRTMPGRRYSDGLHQAIEAKENVKVEAATQTFATVTLQNYFRMYHKLAGMTGTAETEAGEFFEIYKLDVVVIPTNRPIVRNDQQDLVYKTKREKMNAVIEEVEKLRAKGRPVLVGTTSVEVSELLSRMLTLKKVPHNVLNAKQHQREAEIVAEAGLPGTITIATNMAGRGTDIKLGPGVKEAGGLAIIGTERHDSRRVDRQLRGRAGRQGDPGSSQFYVSLEDDLMRLFGSERISKIMDRLGMKEGEVIQHKLITNSITKAQKKVEENNFGMRKRLLEYDDVMNSQREVVYRRRRNALFGDRIRIDLDSMLREFCQQLSQQYVADHDAEGFQMAAIRALSVDPSLTERQMAEMGEEDVAQHLYETAREYYERKNQHLSEVLANGLRNMRQNIPPTVQYVEIPFHEGSKNMRVVVNIDESIQSNGRDIILTLEKAVMLGVIDEKWKIHLREMDDLRQNVQNAYLEQKDPLLVYKFESFNIFDGMLREINEQVITTIFKANLEQQQTPQRGAEGQAQTPPPPPAQVVKEAPVTRDDFSKLKAKHESAEEVQRREAKNLQTNSNKGPVDDRPLSRRERRDIERKDNKRK